MADNFFPYMSPMERALAAAERSVKRNKRGIEKDYEEDGIEYDEEYIESMLHRDVDAAEFLDPAAEFLDPAAPNNGAFAAARPIAPARPIAKKTSTKKPVAKKPVAKKPAVAKNSVIVKKPAPDAAVAKKHFKRLKKSEATPSTTAAKKPTAETSDEEEFEDNDVDKKGGNGRINIAAAAWIVGGKKVEMEE